MQQLCNTPEYTHYPSAASVTPLQLQLRSCAQECVLTLYEGIVIASKLHTSMYA